MGDDEKDGKIISMEEFKKMGEEVSKPLLTTFGLAKLVYRLIALNYEMATKLEEQEAELQSMKSRLLKLAQRVMEKPNA